MKFKLKIIKWEINNIIFYWNILIFVDGIETDFWSIYDWIVTCVSDKHFKKEK